MGKKWTIETAAGEKLQWGRGLSRGWAGVAVNPKFRDCQLQ
jgi:hypothetical protein